MYEPRIDKKIVKRTSAVGTLASAALFFGVTYFVHPLIFPSETTGQGTVYHGVKKGDQKSFGLDRGTVSVLVGLVGAMFGMSLGKGMARDIQRRAELKALINQGKNLS